MIKNIEIDKNNKELIITFYRYHYTDCSDLIEKHIKLFINENITDITIDSVDNSWNFNRCSANLTLITDKVIHYRKWFVGKKSTKYLTHNIRIEINDSKMYHYNIIVFLDDDCIYKRDMR